MPASFKNCVMCGGRCLDGSRVCAAMGCQQQYRQHLQQGGKLCVVCGKPLKNYPATRAACCGAVDCLRQLPARTGPHQSFCAVCGVHVEAGDQASGICSEPYCRDRVMLDRAAQAARRLQQKRERLEMLAQALRCGQRDQEAATREDVEAETAEPIAIVLPANLRGLAPPPAERVAILRENLTKLASEVLAGVAGPIMPELPLPTRSPGSDRESEEAAQAERADSEFDALAGQACGTCRGFCCFAGRNHAFLKVSDLRRTLRDKQLTSADDLVGAYLSYLPEHSVEDSCLFHGPQGCGLPRRLRSDMCNTTLCPSLENLYRKSVGQPPTQRYLMAASNVEDDLATEPRVFRIQLSR